MTRREFMEAVIASEGIAVNVKEFAQKEIEKLNTANAKKTSKPSKKAMENEPIKESIIELLSVGEEMTASMIAEKLEITTQKASALCRQLVDSGKLESKEVKVPKKGTQKAYKIKGEEA